MRLIACGLYLDELGKQIVEYFSVLGKRTPASNKNKKTEEETKLEKTLVQSKLRFQF